MLQESPLYGVPVEVIADLCGVHLDTARRWKRHGTAPAPALALIKLKWECDLGAVAAAWAGWTVRHGELVSPAGDRFTPGLVLAGRYYREQSRAQDAARRRSETEQRQQPRNQSTE